MRTILIVVAGLALMSSAAQAWEISTRCTYSQFYGRHCRTVGTEDRERDPAQEAADWKAKQEQIKKWEAYCSPTRTYDNLGMVRLVYTRQGCEFGRSE